MLVSIGQKIKKLRDEKKLSLRALARESNLSHIAISRFENDVVKPNFSSIKKLASVFHISTDYLLFDFNKTPTTLDVPNFPIPIPIYDKIYAGKETFLDKEITSFITLPREIVGNEERDIFAMTVKDDSMSGEGLLDGSLALIRKQKVAKNGDKVIAVVDGKVVIRKFYKKNKQIILNPANEKWEPIVLDHNLSFQVVGKVIGVYSKVK